MIKAYALPMNKLSLTKRAKILHLLVEGMSLRAALSDRGRKH